LQAVPARRQADVPALVGLVAVQAPARLQPPIAEVHFIGGFHTDFDRGH